MADQPDVQQTTDTGGGTPSADAYQQWLSQAQARLASGQSLDNSGMWDPGTGHYGTPLGYEVQGNQLVKNNNLWGAIWPGLVGVATVGLGGAILAPAAAAQAAGVTGAAATGSSLGSDAAGVGATAGVGTTAGLGTGAATAGAGLGLPSTAGGYLKLASSLGPALSAAAGGVAQGNLAQAGASNAYDRNAVSLYQSLLGNNANQNAFNLQATNLGLEAPGIRAKTAVQGDVLANAKDATISGVPSNIPVPTISGGLRPSMFSPATKALGSAMSSQALAGQQASTTPTVPTWQAPPPPPTLTPLPDGSLATGLGVGGSILNLAGAFGNALSKYAPVGSTPPVQAPNSYIYA